MADLVLTAAKVGLNKAIESEIVSVIYGEAVTAGQIVCRKSDGKFWLADANGAGLQQARAMAMGAYSAGQGGDALKRGPVDGFTIAQAYDAQLFLSDTAGAIADAAGTMTVPIGRVIAAPDKALTKLVYLEFDWVTQWA